MMDVKVCNSASAIAETVPVVQLLLPVIHAIIELPCLYLWDHSKQRTAYKSEI